MNEKLSFALPWGNWKEETSSKSWASGWVLRIFTSSFSQSKDKSGTDCFSASLSSEFIFAGLMRTELEGHNPADSRAEKSFFEVNWNCRPSSARSARRRTLSLLLTLWNISTRGRWVSQSATSKSSWILDRVPFNYHLLDRLKVHHAAGLNLERGKMLVVPGMLGFER